MDTQEHRRAQVVTLIVRWRENRAARARQGRTMGCGAGSLLPSSSLYFRASVAVSNQVSTIHTQ